MENQDEEVLSELERMYTAIRDLPPSHFEQKDQAAVKTMLRNPSMMKALNLLVRGTFNVLIESSNLNILSDKEHTENALRAQGKVGGIVDAIITLLRLAGFEEEAPVIQFPLENQSPEE